MKGGHMSTVDFAITINVSLVLGRDRANVSIKNVDLRPAVITLPLSIQETSSPEKRPKKKTIHEIVLETARNYVKKTGKRTFTAADLFKSVRQGYPSMKRGSFSAHVIAAAPEHPSWKHYANRKGYLYYLGNGTYRLSD
jgi:hypothetical protein